VCWGRAFGVFENLREDIRQARKVNVGPGWWNQHVRVLLQPGTIAVVTYRGCKWVRTVRVPVFRQIMRGVAETIRYFADLLTGVHLSLDAEIGAGFVIHTPYGVFVSVTRIGRNCVVQHGVVISYGVRRIGDNVYFGPGAKVIGRVEIGNNVVVVANSLVMTSVPDNTTVIGVPARIRWQRGESLRFDGSGVEEGAPVRASSAPRRGT
jgi:serine O-acetyltransferase